MATAPTPGVGEGEADSPSTRQLISTFFYRMDNLIEPASFKDAMDDVSAVIRRALLLMHKRDEVEYKRERHVIVRKA